MGKVADGGTRVSDHAADLSTRARRRCCAQKDTDEARERCILEEEKVVNSFQVVAIVAVAMYLVGRRRGWFVT